MEGQRGMITGMHRLLPARTALMTTVMMEDDQLVSHHFGSAASRVQAGAASRGSTGLREQAGRSSGAPGCRPALAGAPACKVTSHVLLQVLSSDERLWHLDGGTVLLFARVCRWTDQLQETSSCTERRMIKGRRSASSVEVGSCNASVLSLPKPQ